MQVPATPTPAAQLFKQLALNLNDLSQRNRALKLYRLRQRTELDLFALGHLEGRTAEQLVTQVILQKTAVLLRRQAGTDAQQNQQDRRLTLLHRELQLREAETGAYDAYVGYPFVQGKLVDGTPVRAPLLLFPVRLSRRIAGGARWSLEPRATDEGLVNPTFFRMYERSQGSKLGEAFWEGLVDEYGSWQELLNELFAFLRLHAIGIQFNSELFLRTLQPFAEYSRLADTTWEAGALKLYPEAVLGIFPRADSALLQDYKVLEQQADQFAPLLADRGEAKPAVLAHPAEKPYVLPVDEHQEALLELAQAGQSLVVEGPPGTGKSQWIVNAVAAQLAAGKRVLVLSQKRAALDVVQRRLVASGLGAAAYLIHDYRTDRAAVYAKLKARLEQAPQLHDLPERTQAYQAISTAVQDALTPLAAYDAALTTVLACGFTPLQLYSLAPTTEPFYPLQGMAASFNRTRLQRLVNKLQGLVPYAALLSPQHPWHTRLSLAKSGTAQLQALQVLLQALPEQGQTLRVLYHQWHLGGVPLLGHERQPVWQAHLQALQGREPSALEALLAWHSPAAGQQLVANLQALTQAATALQALPTHLKKAPPEQLQAWATALGTLTAKPAWRGIFSRRWRQAHTQLMQLIALREEKSTPTVKNRIAEELHVALHFYQLRQSLAQDEALQDVLACSLPSEVQALTEQVQAALAAVALLMQEELLLHAYSTAGQPRSWPHLVHWVQALVAAQQQWQAMQQQWHAGLHAQQLTPWVELIPGKEDLKKLPKLWQQSLAADGEDLQQVDLLLQDFNAEELTVLQQLQPHLATATWEAQLQESLYILWLAQAEEERPALRLATSRGFADLQARLQQALLARQRAVQAWLPAKLAAAAVPLKPATLRELQYQLSKRRQLWPLRKLLGRFWADGLAAYMPCLLASPETVAAILPMAADLFDTVIFDEASQCPVEQALPALLRGHQHLVLGDEHQLPPNRLFQLLGEEEAEDSLTAEESILSWAKRRLPTHALAWHYRSQLAALIAFSNHHFYQGKLLYIPPALPAPAPAISYQQVAGKWQDNRNLAEVEAALQHIARLVALPNPPTLGVITFNTAQQEAMQDALDAQLASWEATGNPIVALVRQAQQREQEGEFQGLFIKNLENVQGDERDVILFSTGYAPEADGQVRAQFGSLSQWGGENRLNVAITRARQQIILLTSFLPSQLSVTHTLHAGPKLFRAYLDYAWAVSNGLLPYELGQALPQLPALTAQLQAALQQQQIDLLPGWNLAPNLQALVPAQHPQLCLLPEDGLQGAVTSTLGRYAYLPTALQAKGWQASVVHARAWWREQEALLVRLMRPEH